MTAADVLLTVLALGVAILLARGSHPVVATLLIASALAVSALLFFPTAMLTDWVGRDRVNQLYGLTWRTPLDPPEWIHLFAFAWLGLLIWLARREARNWRGVLFVAALGVAAELAQWLTDGREPKLEDAALNVAGGLLGVVLARMCCRLAEGRKGWLPTLSGWLLLAGIVLLPLQQWWPLRAGGHGVLASDLLFLLAIVVRGCEWLGGAVPPRWSMLHALLAAWLLASGLAMLQVWLLPDAGLSALKAALKWCGMAYLVVLAALVADYAGRAGWLRRFMLAWVAAAVVASLVSLAAVAGFYLAPDAGWLQGLLSHYGSLPPGPYPRVRGLFANANMFCNYLVVGVCLLLALKSQAVVPGRWANVGLLVMVLAALATLSPGLGGMALAFGLWAWWRRERGVSAVSARVALVAGCVVAVLVVAGMWLNLAAPFEEPSVRARIWAQALQTWWNHPWLGVGIGQDVVGVEFIAPSGAAQWLTDAHNVWLNIGGQAGIVGVVALLALCVWLLAQGLRASRAGDLAAAGCLLGFVCAFLYGGLAGSFEDARHVWVLIGLLGSAGGAAVAGYVGSGSAGDAERAPT